MSTKRGENPLTLSIEGFDYAPVNPHAAFLRLLCGVSAPPATGAFDDPHLVISEPSGETTHRAIGIGSLRAAEPVEGSSRPLLWRVTFAVPLAVAWTPNSLFECKTNACLAIALPRPRVCELQRLREELLGDVALHASAELEQTLARKPGWPVPVPGMRRLGALATTLIIASGPLAPAVAAATTGQSSPESAAQECLLPIRLRPPTLTCPPAPSSAPSTTNAPQPAPAPSSRPHKGASTPAAQTTHAGSHPSASTSARPAGASGGRGSSRYVRTKESPARRHSHPHHPHPTSVPHPGSQPESSPEPSEPSRTSGTVAPESSVPASTSVPTSIPGFGSDTVALSQLSADFASADGPPPYLIPIYMRASKRYHIPWQVLAAINFEETDYGRNVSTSSAGAIGWMQFMPATWAEYAVDADHKGKPNPYDPTDAIFTAARYLAANGGRHNIREAVFAYNHATWYVDEVMLKAQEIKKTTALPKSDAEIQRELAKSGVTPRSRLATLTRNGLAVPPRNAPPMVKAMIEAGNEIAHLPYRYGGGHGSFLDTAYDCSGSLSFIFYYAGILNTPVTSGQLMGMGAAGAGKWVTIYANGDHTFVIIAGLRFDTVALAETGSRWSNRPPDENLASFVVRHPARL